MTTLYKVLKADGSAYHGGTGRWPLPTRNDDGTWTPGDWTPSVNGRVIPCRNGYHLTDEAGLLDWSGPALFVAEGDGDGVEHADPDGSSRKIVFRRARLLRPVEAWTEREMRLFACDVAERVLPIYERDHPGDTRPRDAIAVARRFANGEATAAELAAARAAAWDAVRAAAWDAVRDAARAAAWDAVRAAAWDAVRAAAWDAARDAARDAVRDAAGDAERQWQRTRLGYYLRGETPPPVC